MNLTVRCAAAIGLALAAASAAVAQDTRVPFRLWQSCVATQAAQLDDGRKPVADVARAAAVNCRHVIELADIRTDLPDELRDASAIVRRLRAGRR